LIIDFDVVSLTKHFLRKHVPTVQMWLELMTAPDSFANLWRGGKRMGTEDPATQVFRLWKIVSTLEKVEKGSGGGSLRFRFSP
jgi:hypothetical protein